MWCNYTLGTQKSNHSRSTDTNEIMPRVWMIRLTQDRSTCYGTLILHLLWLEYFGGSRLIRIYLHYKIYFDSFPRNTLIGKVSITLGVWSCISSYLRSRYMIASSMVRLCHDASLLLLQTSQLIAPRCCFYHYIGYILVLRCTVLA